MTSPADVVIIGAGLGGLACAADLASAGAGVVVLERHTLVGGYASSFERGPFTFDVSQHVVGGLGEGGSFWRYLERLGVADGVQVVRPASVVTIMDPEGTIELPNEPEPCIEALSAVSPADEGPLRKLLETCLAVHRDTMTGALDDDMRSLVRGMRVTGQKTFGEVLEATIESPRLRSLLSVLWVLMGLPPSRASYSWFAKILATNYLEGTALFKGGGQALSDALAARAREAGAEIHTSTAATSIRTRNGRVVAVETQKDDVIETGAVVANVDPWALSGLLDEGGTTLPGPSGEPSLSMIVLYLGLGSDPSSMGIPEGVTMITEHDDAEASYRASLKGEMTGIDLAVSNHGALDASGAPDGKHMMHAVALLNGRPWFDLEGDAYARRKREAAETILSRLSARFPDLAGSIEVQETATPRTMFGYTRNHLGAVYGLAQTPAQSGPNRPAPATPVPGLFRTGAWVLPGGGYSAATLSGIMTGREVRRYLARKTPVPLTREERFRLSVFYEDTDTDGVTYHVSYLRFFDRARTEMFMQIAASHGMDLPRAVVTRLEVRYHRPSTLGDTIDIVTRSHFESDLRLVFEQEAILVEDGSKLAEASTEMICVDEEGNPVPCPERALFEGA